MRKRVEMGEREMNSNEGEGKGNCVRRVATRGIEVELEKKEKEDNFVVQ